jgi:PST family polysaccharide transporter
MSAALIQRRDRVDEAFDSAFVASIALGIALTLAGLAAAPLIGLFFHSLRTGLVAAAMAGTILLRLATIAPNARLQRSFSFVRRAVIDPLGTLAFAAGAITAAAGGLGPWSLAIGTYAQLLINVVAAWALVPWRPRLGRASISMWRELAHFGRPVFVANLVSRGTAEAPVAAIGRVLGTGALGQFSYAMRVAAQPISAVVDVGAYSLLPALARVSADDARFRAAVLRSVRWTCAIAFPLGLLLVPLGTPAVVVMFGANWRPAGHAVVVLGVYSAALALDSIASETWKAAGRPDMLPRMHILFFILTVVCVGALVPLGLGAVTVGMALAAVGEGAYAISGIGRVVGIPFIRLLDEVWRPALAAGAMALAVGAAERVGLQAPQHEMAVGVVVLIVQGLAAAAIYVPCLFALSASCRNELWGAVRRRQRQPVLELT